MLRIDPNEVPCRVIRLDPISKIGYKSFIIDYSKNKYKVYYKEDDSEISPYCMSVLDKLTSMYLT